MSDEPEPEEYVFNGWKKDKSSTDFIIDKLHPNQKPLRVGYMSEPNPKLCFDFVALDKVVEDKVEDGITPITAIDGKKIDYPVEIRDELQSALNNPKLAFVAEKDNVVPLSFLSIKEGEVDKGKNWYLHNDPKLPDDIAELMSRYSFGDLKHMTKKEAKNRRKKLAKKGGDVLECNKLGIKKGNFTICFD